MAKEKPEGYGEDPEYYSGFFGFTESFWTSRVPCCECGARVREWRKLQLLGRSYRLKVVRGAVASLRFDGRNFLLSRRARSKATDHFRRWYVQTGRFWLRERVSLLSPKVGVAAARVNIRDIGYRWGSCGRNGVIYFNWKLLQLPLRVADYVIAHELANLLQRHHGVENS